MTDSSQRAPSASLSERAEALRPSATVAVAQKARQLRARGVDVLSFSLGEPDFPTPAHVVEAAVRALRDGRGDRYTSVGGIPELREAIAEVSAARRGGQRHAPAEVVVSVGAKHTLFNLALALFDPGDEVIVPTPAWVSYPAQVRLAGARPVLVPTGPEQGFRLAPEQLEAALTERTRAIVLCTPSNPTGAAYRAEDLRALAEVLERRPDVWVIVDEIYGQLVYEGFEQRSMLEVAPQLRERLVVVDGVSKTYAMTGWRIGWMLGPEPLARAVEKIQGQSTTNPTAVAQHAALAALTGPQEPVERMRAAFAERRRRVVDGLGALPGVRCRCPEGAFYAFPDVSGLLGRRTPEGRRIEDDVQLAEWLLEAAHVALVPGTAFEAPGFLRMSYAASLEQIEEGLGRLGEALATLQ